MLKIKLFLFLLFKIYSLIECEPAFHENYNEVSNCIEVCLECFPERENHSEVNIYFCFYLYNIIYIIRNKKKSSMMMYL
jgi:hypothetical protein